MEKKVAKASRVLAFGGMFIEQHTFLKLDIKSEIKQLFIFLCISYITLKLLLAERLLIHYRSAGPWDSPDRYRLGMEKVSLLI